MKDKKDIMLNSFEGQRSPLKENISLPIKLFFAHSFEDSEKPLVEITRNKLTSDANINIIKLLEWKTIDKGIRIEEVRDIISKCDAALILVSDDSRWVQSELTISKLLRKTQHTTFILIEKSIPRPDIFYNMAQDWRVSQRVFYFNRENLETLNGCVEQVVDLLLPLAEDYIIEETSKEVQIYQSGLGRVTYTETIKIVNLQSQMKKLNRYYLEGYYSVTHDVLERLGVTAETTDDHLREILALSSMSDPNRNPHKYPTFNYRILDSSADNPVTAEKLNEKNPAKEEIHTAFYREKSPRWHFYLGLNRTLLPNEEVRWSYGFTFPTMFTFGKREESAYRARKFANKATFQIDFQLQNDSSPEIKFVRVPELVYYDSNRQEMKDLPVSASPEKHLRFIRYKWPDLGPLEKGEELVVTWHVQ